MDKRNFNILIASIAIGMTAFWLSLYNFILLDINPFEYIQDQFSADDDIVVTIKGEGVKKEFILSLSDIKSSKYYQVEDKQFHFINAIGKEFDKIYSGVSLWSILEEEDILKASASTFIFIGSDGFHSAKPLSLELAEDNMDDVILAYEDNGEPLFNDGPVRSVIDYDVIPDEITTHYWVQNLKYIQID